jgi:ATP-dependent Clp protease ATP-binding subunit ClpA
VFERFTDRARRVVVLAQEEARMLNHNYIGTEHILLGLIHEGEGVAAQAIESMGISLDGVRSQVEEIIGQGQHASTGHIPFTPRAKKVLELSLREALQLGHNYIGTEHILLGLVREGEGVAAQVLVKLGASLDRVRRAVLELLGGRGVGEGEAIDPSGRVGLLRGGHSAIPLFEARAVRAIQLASETAAITGDRVLTPDLLLWGLLSSGDAQVLRALEDLGADPERVRERLRQLTDELAKRRARGPRTTRQGGAVAPADPEQEEAEWVEVEGEPVPPEESPEADESPEERMGLGWFWVESAEPPESPESPASPESPQPPEGESGTAPQADPHEDPDEDAGGG